MIKSKKPYMFIATSLTVPGPPPPLGGLGGPPCANDEKEINNKKMIKQYLLKEENCFMILF